MSKQIMTHLGFFFPLLRLTRCIVVCLMILQTVVSKSVHWGMPRCKVPLLPPKVTRAVQYIRPGIYVRTVHICHFQLVCSLRAHMHGSVPREKTEIDMNIQMLSFKSKAENQFRSIVWSWLIILKSDGIYLGLGYGPRQANVLDR